MKNLSKILLALMSFPTLLVASSDPWDDYNQCSEAISQSIHAIVLTKTDTSCQAVRDVLAVVDRLAPIMPEGWSDTPFGLVVGPQLGGPHFDGHSLRLPGDLSLHPESSGHLTAAHEYAHAVLSAYLWHEVPSLRPVFGMMDEMGKHFLQMDRVGRYFRGQAKEFEASLLDRYGAASREDLPPQIRTQLEEESTHLDQRRRTILDPMYQKQTTMLDESRKLDGEAESMKPYQEFFADLIPGLLVGNWAAIAEAGVRDAASETREEHRVWATHTAQLRDFTRPENAYDHWLKRWQADLESGDPGATVASPHAQMAPSRYHFWKLVEARREECQLDSQKILLIVVGSVTDQYEALSPIDLWRLSIPERNRRFMEALSTNVEESCLERG